MARRLHADREDLIQKAVGWMLREAGKADPARLERYLTANVRVDSANDGSLRDRAVLRRANGSKLLDAALSPEPQSEPSLRASSHDFSV